MDGWAHYHDTTGLDQALQLEFRLPLACTTSHKSLAALAKQNENTSEHRSVTSPTHSSIVLCLPEAISGGSAKLRFSITTQMPHTSNTFSVRNQSTAQFWTPRALSRLIVEVSRTASSRCPEFAAVIDRDPLGGCLAMVGAVLAGLLNRVSRCPTLRSPFPSGTFAPPFCPSLASLIQLVTSHQP
jgi:hypothetical protein